MGPQSIDWTFGVCAIYSETSVITEATLGILFVSWDGFWVVEPACFEKLFNSPISISDTRISAFISQQTTTGAPLFLRFVWLS